MKYTQKNIRSSIYHIFQDPNIDTLPLAEAVERSCAYLYVHGDLYSKSFHDIDGSLLKRACKELQETGTFKFEE